MKKRLLLTVLAVCSLFFSTFLAHAKPQQEVQESNETKIESVSQAQGTGKKKDGLVGVWDLVLTFSDGSVVKSTLNVAPGRRTGEGSVIHSAEGSLILPNPTTSEQGVWEFVSGQKFVASYAGFAVDEGFKVPAGKIGFQHSITLNGDEESFTGQALFEVRDAAGAILFSDKIQTRGTRQHPKAPLF